MTMKSIIGCTSTLYSSLGIAFPSPFLRYFFANEITRWLKIVHKRLVFLFCPLSDARHPCMRPFLSGDSMW